MSSQGPPQGQSERRLQVRVRLSDPLMARHLAGADTFLVEEASLGGFSLRADVEFEPGTEHHFKVASPMGEVAMIAAVCRYCTLVGDAAEPPHYLVGFQFSPQPTRRLRLFLGAIAMDAPTF